MSWRLLKIGLSSRYPEPRMFRMPEKLAGSYDVVIIGAGGHGLASAYYLAQRHGIRRIAVLEKGYIGSGNTGRNTTIIRSNYLTPEGVRFYDRSVQLWRDLSEELGLNLFYSTRGHYTLAHTDASHAHDALARGGEQAPRRGLARGRRGTRSRARCR